MSEAETTETAIYNDAEAAVVSLLGAQWVKWQEQYPLTIGTGVLRMMWLVTAVDKHVTGVEDMVVARSMAVEKLNELLAPQTPDAAAQFARDLEPKLKAIEEADPESRDYLLRTVHLFADALPTWLREDGLAGILATLVQIRDVYQETFNAAILDSSVKASSVEFLAAFELRARFGFADMEVEALRLLSEKE